MTKWRFGVQAVHEEVPPDALAPLLRQLVDQFVHDRARPEVMTLGLKTVRELCERAPLIMTPELLQVRARARNTLDVPTPRIRLVDKQHWQCERASTSVMSLVDACAGPGAVQEIPGKGGRNGRA